MKVEMSKNPYLKADFVRDRQITAVTIVGKSEITKFENEKTHKVTARTTVPISFGGQKDDDPTLWTLNNKSQDSMIRLFGDETDHWIGNVIDLMIIDGQYSYIVVDEVRTGIRKGMKAKEQL